MLSSHCRLSYTLILRQFEHKFRDKETNFSGLDNQSKVRFYFHLSMKGDLILRLHSLLRDQFNKICLEFIV